MLAEIIMYVTRAISCGAATPR